MIMDMHLVSVFCCMKVRLFLPTSINQSTCICIARTLTSKSPFSLYDYRNVCVSYVTLHFVSIVDTYITYSTAAELQLANSWLRSDRGAGLGQLPVV